MTSDCLCRYQLTRKYLHSYHQLDKDINNLYNL